MSRTSTRAGEVTRLLDRAHGALNEARALIEAPEAVRVLHGVLRALRVARAHDLEGAEQVSSTQDRDRTIDAVWASHSEIPQPNPADGESLRRPAGSGSRQVPVVDGQEST